jgi:hypothetical protein
MCGDQDIADAAGDGVAAVHDPDRSPGDRSDDIDQERVVGAAEDDGVDAVRDERHDHVAQLVRHLVRVALASLDPVGEAGHADRPDVEPSPVAGQEVRESGAGGRDGGRQDGDLAGNGQGGRRLDGRLKADDWEGDPLTQEIEGTGGGGVAGHDDGLHAAGGKCLADLQGAVPDEFDRALAVRAVRAVGNVQDRFPRELAPELVDDAEPAQA